MANFSANQTLQLYIVTSNSDSAVTSASSAGTLGTFTSITDGVRGKQIMFNYKGVDSVLNSDLIQTANILEAKAFKASDQAVTMRKVVVTLDSNINSGAPVGGQDYVLGINFKGFFSSGDASQYYKDTAVHASASMTASEFYKAMVEALNRCFSREADATATSNPYLKFMIRYTDDTDTSATLEVTDSGYAAATATGIVIEEKAQESVIGLKKARRVHFDLRIATIYSGGDDVTWGTSAEMTGTTTVGNGEQIAQLEWWAAGERGDQYRGVGYPNYIPTEYLADKTAQYNVISIRYAFTDTGIGSYRTEKELLIACPLGTTGSEYTVVNAVISKINTAYGTTLISTLS